MDDYLRIDEAEFAQMLNDAGKILIKMSPETITELRTLCTDELGKIAKNVSADSSKFKELAEQMKEPVDYDKDNPVKQSKIRFWLGQLANFIAVSVFRLPREFTPTYAYPPGSPRKFVDYAKATDEKLNRLVQAGKAISESLSVELYEIKRKITEDDARLIVFCHSCENIDTAYSKVNVSDHFRKTASLLYLNNVPFPVNVYRSESGYTKVTDAVSSMIEKVKNRYSEARGNKAL